MLQHLFCFVFCLFFIMVSGSNYNNYANTIHYLVTSLAIEISYMFVYLHYHPHLLASIFDAGLGWMAWQELISQRTLPSFMYFGMGFTAGSLSYCQPLFKLDCGFYVSPVRSASNLQDKDPLTEKESSFMSWDEGQRGEKQVSCCRGGIQLPWLEGERGSGNVLRHTLKGQRFEYGFTLAEDCSQFLKA